MVGVSAVVTRNLMSKNRLPAPKVLQSVVEWSFPRAHRYWDDCGKLIGEIEKAFPSLVCQGLQGDGFHFSGQSKGITTALFYWDKANIAQAGRGDASLADAARAFWPLVKNGLGISHTKRIGHRSFLVYETSSIEEAQRFAAGMPLVELSARDREVLGRPVTEGTVIRTSIEVGGRRLRVEVNAGAMIINTRSHHGLIVDVDISLDGAAIEDVSDVGEFVDWNVQFLREDVGPLFRAR